MNREKPECCAVVRWAWQVHGGSARYEIDLREICHPAEEGKYKMVPEARLELAPHFWD